jgi:hypothetical protein
MLCDFDGLLSVTCLKYSIPLSHEKNLKHLPDIIAVIGNQDSRRPVSAAGSRYLQIRRGSTWPPAVE